MMQDQMNQTEQSRKIATLFLDNMLSGKTDALLDLFHEDGTWQLMGDSNGFPVARTYQKSEVLALMGTIAVPHDMLIEGIMADGRKAAIEFHPTAKAVNGKTYDNHLLFLFDIEDGRIRSLKEYLDTRHLQEILNH